MESSRSLLRDTMRQTAMSQSALARISGVHQPSISQFLSGRIEMSDDQVDRLLSCMGHRLEVTRRATIPDLTRAELRSWRLHRAIAARFETARLENLHDVILANLDRLQETTQGHPHVDNMARWSELLRAHDATGIRRALTGLDRSSIEMREVSPFGGVLSDAERRAILQENF